MHKRGLSLFTLALSITAPAIAQSAQITEIEINQALGRQLNGALNFVAGKDTVVRVYLDTAVAIQPDQTSLAIQRDGQNIVTLTPRPTDGAVNIVEFLCPSRTDCGSWIAGSYLFTATVNGVTKSTDGTTYNFVPRMGLRILARAIKANFAGAITSVRDDRWRKAWEYTRRVYPVGADQIFWDVREELDASDSMFDLETNDGRFNVWQALANLVPQHCAANRNGPGCYDLVVGFISDRPSTYPNGTLQGFTYGRPANVVVASDEDMEATISHEIAHLYSAGDTYDGGSFNCSVNPAPDGFNGKDFNTPDNPVSCTAGRVTFPGASATRISADSRPYEVGGRGALGDLADFMGSGTKQENFWITPEVYSQVFAGLDPALKSGANAAARAAAAPQRLLFYGGSINAGGTVRVEPWYGLSSTEAVSDSTGDTQIQAVDAAGKVLASQQISPQFYVRTNPPTIVDWAPFEGALRFPDATAKFQIVQKGAVLYEIAVSANDPVISAVSPTSGGGTLDGPQTLTWTASDPDGDSLLFTVEYNPSPDDPNSEWLVLAPDIRAPQWQDDFSTLPGAKAGAIRITATDGIRAATAQSQTFAVPFKAPLVYIDDLAGGSTFKKGQEIRLDAEAEDLQDGVLDNEKLVWTSDISGRLGMGSTLVLAGLAPGSHTITLTATNSAGLSASQSIRITVQ